MRIFLACALTVLIETPFLALWGYRKRDELIVIVCANVVTNLLLNLLLWRVPSLYGPAVYGLEALVVAAEFGIYRLAFGPRRGLFWLTLAANALSYGLGLLIAPLL
ncbi:MAG: hypothetical protein II458_05230 [Oscillospiraceae bacterium]|nr:hypothetical protein [Oscillospiraceae bacterium]